jgi:hypothetical protein
LWKFFPQSHLPLHPVYNSLKRGKTAMKILNFGSLNIDYTYKVPHFVGRGETLAALDMKKFPGGKGLNQSVALGRSGA